MANLKLNVDTSKLMAFLAKFEREVLQRHLKAAAEITAQRVANEARRRVAVRSGASRAAIHVQPAGPTGFRVLAGVSIYEKPPSQRPAAQFAVHVRLKTGRLHTQRVTQRNVPLWLEFGTKHMVAQPYFFASAKLETDAYRRRVVDAINDAAEEVGLGG